MATVLNLCKDYAFVSSNWCFGKLKKLLSAVLFSNNPVSKMRDFFFLNRQSNHDCDRIYG